MSPDDPLPHPAPISLRHCGRTLARSRIIAVMIGVGGIAAAWGIWNWKGEAQARLRCMGSSDTSAISTLRSIAQGQAQYQAAAFADEDRDGVGEAGGFLELVAAIRARGRPDEPLEDVRVGGCCGPGTTTSGTSSTSGTTSTSAPSGTPGTAPPSPAGPAPATSRRPARAPLLSGAFRTLQPDGAVSRSGYRFRIHLQSRDGSAATERLGTGFPDGLLDPDVCEKHWVCYAWPALQGTSGVRSFVVDESGDIFGTVSPLYTGTAGPRPGAAKSFGGPESVTGPIVPGVPAQDGNVWVKVN